MELNVKAFGALTVEELYAILKLRVDVFVVEQRCAYPELDGMDAQALHVFLTGNGEIAAYLRILPEGMQFKDAAGIGRVIARKRGEGLGAEILRAGIDVARRQFHAKRIRLEAQSYAQGFYEKAGFVRCSEEFDEDGIPHVEMFLNL